ncbi:Protein DHS-27 [Aphelenchoides avenae]|nr:Protein DHS-27 [Aphelenchus avenae]
MAAGILDSLYYAVYWVVSSYITFRICRCLYIVIRSVHAHFFTKPMDLTPFKESWTVATGCTDGIGRAYVEELARARGLRKFHLIGRSKSKLDDVAKDLKEKFGCEIRQTVFDFEKDDYEALRADLKDLDVGILFNCAGIAPTRVGNFAELEEGLPSKILRVNLMSTIKMIELVLPGMLKRDKGIVVNIGSATGWRSLPYMSTYPASKVAISFYTDTLADEFAHTNCLIPALVATKVASYETEEANNIWVVDTKTFARQAVNIIGNFRLSTGCFMHDIHLCLGCLISFNLFKAVFVPLVMLGVHKKRVEDYQTRNNGGVKSE